ncbi:methyltransferase [Vibrio maerlii]|uniref:methyltransferase n=1 Tax=Vibrio maerlii TaxID=2231648 RepID=UPI000E3CC1FC|nr:methyltransferase [Vibrio maerlii]
MQTAFTQLSQLLQQYRPLWQVEAFYACRKSQVEWAVQYPELYQWLLSLSWEEVDSYKQDTRKLIEAVNSMFPVASVLQQLTNLDTLDSEESPVLNSIFSGVPGRKVEQIRRFGQYALAYHQGDEWLEWCAGKGYLGRVLSSGSGDPTLSFEWQESLCESGQHEANKLGLNMTFVQGDAFSEKGAAVLSKQHAVALHACGDLHVRLLKLGAKSQLPAMTVSPCCYHLIHDEHYQPLSQLGQQLDLQLNKTELRIPLQETVTGGERVKRHRQLEMSYRLGLDALRCDELNEQEYQSVPSIQKSKLNDGFEAFCRWAEEKKQFGLMEHDWPRYESIGQQRFELMERLSLVQQLFRRPLEIWLAMDKVSFLNEYGYQTQLSIFCDRQVTPRNLIIHASLSYD